MGTTQEGSFGYYVEEIGVRILAVALALFTLGVIGLVLFAFFLAMSHH